MESELAAAATAFAVGRPHAISVLAARGMRNGIACPAVPGAVQVPTEYVQVRGVNSVYIGPDSLMPVATAIATAVGFVLMFWRRLTGAVRMLVGRIVGAFGRR